VLVLRGSVSPPNGTRCSSKRLCMSSIFYSQMSLVYKSSASYNLSGILLFLTLSPQQNTCMNSFVRVLSPRNRNYRVMTLAIGCHVLRFIGISTWLYLHLLLILPSMGGSWASHFIIRTGLYYVIIMRTFCYLIMFSYIHVNSCVIIVFLK
jgi:hypothetical protein